MRFSGVYENLLCTLNIFGLFQDIFPAILIRFLVACVTALFQKLQNGHVGGGSELPNVPSSINSSKPLKQASGNKQAAEKSEVSKQKVRHLKTTRAQIRMFC